MSICSGEHNLLKRSTNSLEKERGGLLEKVRKESEVIAEMEERSKGL